MGDPVRVRDLATDLIALSGLEAGIDIEVRYTGIRPGEKLFEELFFKGDHVTPTIHPKILRASDAEGDSFCADDIETLIAAAQENRPPAEIRRLIAMLVPEFTGQLEGSPLVIATNGEGDTGTVVRLPARVAANKARTEQPLVATATVRRQ
jgi:FlaA1/EpsC-like NDP-sugar epimerase